MFDLFSISSPNRVSNPESARTASNNDDPPPNYESAVQAQSAVDPDEKAPVENPEPQVCLFYRIYNENGGIKSRTAVDDNNPYLGCIDPHLISPPHTVESIKRCICRLELIEDNQAVDIYASSSKTTPMNDTEHIAILSGSGPGSTPKRPIALVRRGESSDASKVVSRVMARYGALFQSKRTQPHKLGPTTTTTVTTTQPTGPGSTPKPPIALVRRGESSDASKVVSRVKARYGALFQSNRTQPHQPGPTTTTTTTTTQSMSAPLQPDGEFKIKIKAKLRWGYVASYPEWLPYAKDEVLYTDGVIHRATYHSGSEYAVYRARNAAGQVGWVVKSLVDHDDDG